MSCLKIGVPVFTTSYVTITPLGDVIPQCMHNKFLIYAGGGIKISINKPVTFGVFSALVEGTLTRQFRKRSFDVAVQHKLQQTFLLGWGNTAFKLLEIQVAFNS